MIGLEADCQLGVLCSLARTGIFENLCAVCDWALSFSLALKILVDGQKPSRASGTETESHSLTRLRLSKAPIVKDTLGLNSATVFLKTWL